MINSPTLLVSSIPKVQYPSYSAALSLWYLKVVPKAKKTEQTPRKAEIPGWPERSNFLDITKKISGKRSDRRPDCKGVLVVTDTITDS